MPTRRSAISWTKISPLLLFLLSGSISARQLQQSLNLRRSPVERMETAHLKATHADVLRLQAQRHAASPLAGLRDYKAILHAHAEDSAHTGGTREEMLADAKKAGVQIIMLTDHLRPPHDFISQSWRGLHGGVLFIPGSEARGFLIYPVSSIMDKMDQQPKAFISTVTANDGLIFLSHLEERPDHSTEGLIGMEICNRHYDAKKDVAGLIAIALKMLEPARLAELQEDVRLYPDECLAAQVEYPELYLKKWDADTALRHLTGVAANDCHHNQVLILKVLDEKTVLLGTNVDKDEAMRRFTVDSHSGIAELTRGKQPGDVIARVDFDPYYRSFRNMTTHILAEDLTEAAVRSALRRGHAYVSHDWMCDATGFSFVLFQTTSRSAFTSATTQRALPDQPPSSKLSADERKSSGQEANLMGDEVNFTGGQKLIAAFPVNSHIRLLRNGAVIKEVDAAKLEYPIAQPGVYRLEGWLTLDGEPRPWIYSNPIYLR
jgi:hypothetical protein